MFDDQTLVKNVREALNSLNMAMEAAGRAGIEITFIDQRLIGNPNPNFLINEAIRKEKIS